MKNYAIKHPSVPGGWLLVFGHGVDSEGYVSWYEFEFSARPGVRVRATWDAARNGYCFKMSDGGTKVHRVGRAKVGVDLQDEETINSRSGRRDLDIVQRQLGDTEGSSHWDKGE